MDYQPGDVANGHVLGADGAWHPVAVGQPVTRLDPNQYGARYLRRWKWTVLTLVVMFMLPVVLTMFVADAETAITGGLIVGPLWLFGSLCGAVFVGSLVNLIVAAFPTDKARRTSP